MRGRGARGAVGLLTLVLGLSQRSHALSPPGGAGEALLFAREDEARAEKEKDLLCNVCPCPILKTNAPAPDVLPRLHIDIHKDTSSSVIGFHKDEAIKILRDRICRPGAWKNPGEQRPPSWVDMLESIVKKADFAPADYSKPQEIHGPGARNFCWQAPGSKDSSEVMEPKVDQDTHHRFTPLVSAIGSLSKRSRGVEDKLGRCTDVQVDVLITDGVEWEQGQSTCNASGHDPKADALDPLVNNNPCTYVFIVQVPQASTYSHAAQVDCDAKRGPRKPWCDGKCNVPPDPCHGLPRCSFAVFDDKDAAAVKLSKVSFKYEAERMLDSIRNGRPVFALHKDFSQITRPFADAVMIGNDARWYCSGVAVDERTVLTAAHCLPATRVRVTEGIEQQGTTLLVREALRHPDLKEDLALLRLSGKLEVDVKPRRHVEDANPPGSVLRYVGFGVTGQNGFGHKKLIDIGASGWACDGTRALTSGCRAGFEMVLPGSAGSDTCSGDSGGPVYELLGDGTFCSWRLLAITSRRVADAVAACGSGGIYTRVDVADGWIKETLKRWGDEDGVATTKGGSSGASKDR